MIERLLHRRRVYLVALALVTAGFGVFAVQVEIEQNNESMNSLSAQELRAHDVLRETFGEDEELVLAVVMPDLISEPSLRVLDELTGRIEAIPGVRRVYSLSNAIELVPGRDGAVEQPLLPEFGSDDFERRVAQAIARNPELSGFLIGTDNQTAGLLVELEHRPGDNSYRRVVIDALRALADDPPGERLSLFATGIAAQKYEVSRLLARDQGILIPASVGVLGLVLLLFFKSLAGVVLPLGVTGVTLVWTLGLYQIAGFRLNTMTALLPPVLMVLSVTTSVHLLERWRRRRGEFRDGYKAIAAVVAELRFPCTLTSLTTALGMSSLVLNATPAVQTFGAFTAIGVLISLGVSMTLVPVGLSYLAVPSKTNDSGVSQALDPILRSASRLSRERPLPILASGLALTAAALVGITQIQNNTDLIRFLKNDNPLYRDTLFIDAHLTGVNVLELVVSRRDGAPLDSADTTRRLTSLRESILQNEQVSDVQSVLALLQAIHRAESSRADFDENAVLQAWDVLSAAGDSGLVRRLVNEDFTRTRIRVLIRAIGTADAAPLEDAILASSVRNLGGAFRVEATGSFHQVVRDSNRLVASQVRSFAAALALVLLTIGVMLRSWRLMLISVVPNVVPILWTGGLMGALGIDLSTGTAMIASVVIGISVDDTIHYLTRYRREQSLGVRVAIHRTTTDTGRALMISSVVLAVGFWVGVLGSFKPTVYFSLFTGLTMFSALACDLLILPAILVLGSNWRNTAERNAS